MENSEQPAHPAEIEFTNGNKTKFRGVTKREYFAAMAMQGLLSIYDNGQNAICPNEENVIYMAKISVKAADELLKQLES